MTTVNLNVGDVVPFDVNSTIPALPVGALTFLASNAVHVTVNPDNTGTITAIAPSTSAAVTFRAAGYSSTTATFVIAPAIVKPPVVVNFGAVVPAE